MRVKPEFFHIDKHRLDEEWEDQASTFYEFSTKLADAREDHDRFKAKLDVIEAEFDKGIRQRPEEFGVEKITEKAVEKTIILQTKYRDARDDVIRSKHDVDICEAAVKALEHKKKGLESMVYLQSQGYNSEPTGPRLAKERVMDWEKKNVRNKGREED